MQNNDVTIDGYRELKVPGFVTITDVTPHAGAEPEYVICNEATGKFFLANRVTVEFFTALKDTQQVAAALAQVGMPPTQVGPLLKKLLENGLITNPGETHVSDAAPVAPLENKLVTVRWDILDIQRLTHRLRGLGRFAYSPLGYAIWGVLMLGMAFELLSNRDKVALTIAQVLEASWQQWAIFAAFFVGLKIVHELGHALAYRQMCIQEGVEPGPIRVGICIFALSPFPFTDVTGAWRLKSTGRRVMIGAGGVYFETWAMAALTFIWAETQTGLVQTVILQVVIVAGALALLFNLNPAIKLDGYFMLTDYLRRPNLAARAAMAARSTAARLLGADLPRQRRSELIYWLMSYAYRWTIFAGIFWIFYQIDPRLAPVAAAVVLMTLVVRPLINTARFVRRSGAKPLKTLLAGAAIATIVAALFIPLPGRMLMQGQMMLYDTRFVEATEAGQLLHDSAGWRLENPELDQRIAHTNLQGLMLENLKRASFASAQEQARLASEIDANTDAKAQLEARRAKLVLFTDGAATSEIWTPMQARWLGGSWVRPAANDRLGAVSSAAPPHLLFRLDQSRLRRDLTIAQGMQIQVRAVIRPACSFPAQIRGELTSLIARNGLIYLKADVPDREATCAFDLTHGSALVGRLEMPRSSLAARAWLSVARALQDRLPLEQQ